MFTTVMQPFNHMNLSGSSIQPNGLQLMANRPPMSFTHKIIATPSTVFIGDIPKGVSQVEIFEYLKEHVGGDFEIILKR